MISCTSSFSLTPTSPNCNASTDWANNPGTCRLRIKNFNAALFSGAGCASCTGTVANTWDGTFPDYHAPVLGSWTFRIDPTTVSLFGRVPLFGSNCACGFLNGSGFYVALSCNGAPALYMWSSAFNGAGPLGIYTGPGIGCSPGPASIEIEAYSL
jgi:hypothetical protein